MIKKKGELIKMNVFLMNKLIGNCQTCQYPRGPMASLVMTNDQFSDLLFMGTSYMAITQHNKITNSRLHVCVEDCKGDVHVTFTRKDNLHTCEC